MKQLIVVSAFLLASVYACCQNNRNAKLIDGISVDKCLFKKEDVKLNTYKFDGIFIENLEVKKILSDSTYRNNFFEFLKNGKNEDDFKAALFAQLLMIRIEQLKDPNAYYLLSKVTGDESLSYKGVELLSDNLVELFLEDPYFFVQQTGKYHDTVLLSFLMTLLDDFIVKENFFLDKLCTVSLSKNLVLLNPKMQHEFNCNKLTDELKRMPRIEAIFSLGSYTGWESKTEYFTDIHRMFDTELPNRLTSVENKYYKDIVVQTLGKYRIRNYHVSDPDGYVNLREKADKTSAVILRINDGEYVCFIGEEKDWVLVETSGGKQGYIHKTRLKEL
ncbi:SH3 domain-containing protein [Chitinophagaceae bacterium MMS25-I14]